jgi:hypothetical protein
VRRLVLGLIISVAASGPAGAAIYYIDADNGRDEPSCGGSGGDPWRTIAYALSRVTGENTFMCRGTFEEEVTVAREDRESVFTANPDATLTGWLKCDFETGADLNGFDVYGFAAGGSKNRITSSECYFSNPVGYALGIDRFYGGAAAVRCRLEDCEFVCDVSNWEFGELALTDCDIRDCERGIKFYGGARTTLTRCVFSDLAGAAFDGHYNEDGAAFSGCEVYGCLSGIILYAGNNDSYWADVENCIFRDNGQALSVTKEGEPGTISITGNRFAENDGNAVALAGVTIKLRGNVVTDNGGHGVYIGAGDPDLGTAGDPGGNTFAGNKSGYDVYNASSEDIPAYGNGWDPQSEQEMRGKTWQDVNVTRIYDHWDNPSCGYVMWSDPASGVAPASLGRIKALFSEGPALNRPAPQINVTGD